MDEPRWALITGAANGIGRACAVRFAQDGYSLILVDIAGDALDTAAAEVRNLGAECLTFQVDVASTAQITDMFNAVRTASGRVDVLINSAGIRQIGSIASVTEAEWDHVMAVNVRGAFMCIQQAIPFMREQGGGRIINIGSVSGLKGFGNRAPYCASKAALHGLTKQAAIELSPMNIQVNAVAPGYTSETAMTDLYSNDAVAAMIRTLPAGGRRTRPDEVAHAVAFLASDGAQSITGSVVVLDWGLTESIAIDAPPWRTDAAMIDGTRAS